MRVVVIADYGVVFGDASLTQRNHLGGIVQLAYALHFGIVTRQSVRRSACIASGFRLLPSRQRSRRRCRAERGRKDRVVSEAALLKDTLGMASYPGIKTRLSE